MTSYRSAMNTMTLTRRRVPDVPQDIVDDHFNDPNYDFTPLSPAPSSTAIELESPRFRKLSLDTPVSAGFGAPSMDGVQSYTTAPEFNDESPYAEVRAAVSSVDDPSMPVGTFRMWTLGLLFTVFISGVNQFLSMRFPTVLITGIVAQLVALPLGKAMEYLLPTTRFRTFGYVWSLNPGPFNIKEHVVITVMAKTVVYGAYATDIVNTQHVFYKQSPSLAYQLLLVLSIQLLGFSLGGHLRKLAVWPASMIWPGALVNAALFNTLHRNFGTRERRHMPRERFFIIVLAASAVWYWVPGYLFTALSVFNWVCWIRPDDPVVNALFGTVTGLGMGVGTFDWAVISYTGSPLVTPWWVQANVAASLVICFWIIAPIVYFTNTFFTQYLPISSTSAFDNTGALYSPTDIITDGQFDLAKYQAYSPVFVPAAFAVAYGVAFAAFGATIMHTFLWYRRDIVRRFRSNLSDERDVHARLMLAYPETPQAWFTWLGIGSFLLLTVAVTLFPLAQLPVWGLVIAFALALVLSIPLSILQAITNQFVALQVVHEMIAGYLFPGRPVANMIFKAVAEVSTEQAVALAGNLKLGQYMKIPPRIMVGAQVLAVVLSCFVVTAVQELMRARIVGFCEPEQKDGFICPSTSTFATASLIWGGIGPRRLFGTGTLYTPLLFAFPVGLLLPVPFYFLARRYPFSLFRYVNFPAFFAGVGGMPPATGINYSSWVLTGFIFNYFLRRHRFRWWMRYNYILSAGLDAGVALALVLLYFAVQLPHGGIALNWIGNTIWMRTADAEGRPVKVVQPGTTFGPTRWK